MKRLFTWFLVVAMLVSATVFPVAVFATETETAATDIVHFDYDLEDYAATDTTFPKTATETYGKWNPYVSSAGEVINGWDGKAFKFTCAESAFTYRPTTKMTSGKYLVSFDFMYDTEGSADAAQFVLLGDNTIYLMNFENPSGSFKESIRGASSSWRCTEMFLAQPNTVYTIESIIDIDNHKIIQYVNGVETHTYETDALTGITQFKFYTSKNFAGFDNLKIIENPTKYTFEQTGDITTDDNAITVKFSDSVNAKATDFIIDDGTGVTVTGVEKISGKKLKLTLSDELSAGNHTVALTNESLASGIGTTPSNTSSAFTVRESLTYFDIDFEHEGKFGIQDYLGGFSDNGAWDFAGGADVFQTKVNGFEGDKSTGVQAVDEVATVRRNIGYTFKTPITDGKLTISFDATFDSTINTERMQMLYINNDANNGNLLTYGTGSGDTADSTVIAGAKADMHYSGGTKFSYEDNKAYRWDTVIDLDNKKVVNYCDGVAFNEVTLSEDIAEALTSISSVYLRVTPSVVFFDNYKITHNVSGFNMTAGDISSKSNETYVDFGDTLANDISLVFTDPSGAQATPESITRISPRRYKVVFNDLVQGTYTVSAPSGVTSALGGALKNNTATFNVAERPVIVKEYVEYDMIREHPKTFDFEGAVANPNKYTDTDGVTKVIYNDTTWKVSGGSDDGHVFALTTDELKQNGKYSVELRSTDDSTMCAFYANRFWMGRQGGSVSGSIWVYWPSTTTSQYFYLEVANYNSSGQQGIIAKSAKYYANNIEKDKWVQIPIKPIEGMGIDAALQVKIRFKGIEPIYVDNLSLGAVEEFPYGYYVTDASHTIEDGTVTAKATIKKKSYYGDGAVIIGAIYDDNNTVVGAKTFECDADEKEVSMSATTDDFKMAKWFIMEDDGTLSPAAESKADRKTAFKILCHNVGKYSHGAGAGVPTADIDEATQVYLDFLNEVDADVFCAQEHAHYFDDAETVTATEQVFGKVYDYNYKSSETKAYVYQGQAIYSKIPLKDTEMGDLPTDFEDRDKSQRGYTKAVIEIDGKEVAIFNSHFSLGGVDFRNPSRDILIEEMNKYEYAILCMDANSSYKEWQQFLDAGYVLGNGNNGEFITTTLKDDDLRNTEDRHFVGSGSIDQILVSPTLEIKNFDSIFNSVYSDHLPITAEIAFK